jgi:hypothetical protein
MASQVQVISHWYKSLEHFQTSSLDLYSAIEAAVKSREVPDIENSRVTWKEGGLLSDERIYLRIRRRRLNFDICVAPFGNGFFVSWWLVEQTPSGTLATFITVTGFFLSFFFLVYELGLFSGFVLWVCGLLVAFALIATEAQNEADWVQPILEIPLFGTLMKRLFQPLTYYRIDTTLMFQQAIHASVLEVLDQLLNSKGLRPLPEADRKPIMREFFHG